MEILADDWLDYKYKFQTFFQQAALLLEKNDEKLRHRIQEKSSLEFLKKLDEHVANIEKSSFCAEKLQINCYPVSARFIEESMQKLLATAVAERIRKVAQDIKHNIDIYQHYEMTKEERTDLMASLKMMQKRSTLRATYKNFFTWMGKLFPCKKTILGDANQSVNPFSSSIAEKIT